MSTYVISKDDYLAHHGVKGQKWGVRRYQNKDGSLTSKGIKRYNTMQRASEIAKKKAHYESLNAKDYRESSQKFAKKYNPNEQKGREKWLLDMYGKDYKDKKYMKEVFDIDDVNAHAKEGIKREIADREKEGKMMSALYEKRAKEWMTKSDAWRNTPISEINKNTFKEAKKLVKEDNKATKRYQRAKKVFGNNGGNW